MVNFQLPPAPPRDEPPESEPAKHPVKSVTINATPTVTADAPTPPPDAAEPPLKPSAKPSMSNVLIRSFAAIEAALSTYAHLFHFLAFYSLAMVLMWLWGFHGEIKHQPNIDVDDGAVFRYIIGVARGAGYTLNLNTSLVILLAARYTFTSLRDTPFASMLPLDKVFPLLHIVVAYSTALGVLIHMSFHFGWLIGFSAFDDWGLWSFNMSVTTGVILTILFAVMIVFAQPRIRRSHFITFYRVHLIGATLFYAILIFHGMYRNRPETYKYIIPSLIIYMIDRFLRHAHASNTTLQLTSTNSFFKDATVLELRVPKPFAYRAGQYVELQVPSINREWHPFTIASAPHEETLAVYIKKLGDWTGELHEKFSARIRGDDTSMIAVRVRGPYGAPCQHVRGYDRVVLISGGIGATPFSAVCKELHHLQARNGLKRAVTERRARLRTDAETTAAEKRVFGVIAQLYNVNVDAALDEVSAVDEQRSAFVTDLLRAQSMRRPSSVQLSLSLGMSSDEEDDEEDDSNEGDERAPLRFAEGTKDGESGGAQTASVDGADVPAVHLARKYVGRDDSIFVATDKRKSRARQQRIHMFDIRSQLLSTLHSTRMQFVILLLLMARIGVICAGSIWHSTFVSILLTAIPDDPEGKWVVIADSFLSGIVLVLVALTLCVEVWVLGVQFFSRAARVLDVLLLLPAAIASFALSVDAYARGAPISSGVIALHFIVCIPVMYVLMLLRLHSTVGGRRLTDVDSGREVESQQTVPDVDFVWTSPKADDDLWLRQELEPLAEGTQLRLHRYLTREKTLGDEEDGGDEYITSTKLGRPDWDAIFSEVMGRAKSDATVGVFFCGPHRMGQMIRKSIRKVEVVSALKGAYLRGVGAKTISRDMGVDKSVVKALRERGCAVRFVFREENFG
eukprot:TRINITY_DN70755_c0_g1_i1.p1 TRINITY_DN70755_c0_g1~~TRINITY_DN70755_c0_g1_i1.p1  ORF type:complete len:953 (+),score=210.01 TRINITY_DN70755_c0_g1_i1:139-2859(+)